MKKVMVILAALFILTAASVAALKWLELGPFDNSEVTDVEDETKEKPRLPTITVDMETIQFPILKEGVVGATAQIQIKFETEGLDNASVLKRKMPKIHDAFFRDLFGFLPRILQSKDRIDDKILKQRLQIISERIVEKTTIKRILLQYQLDNQLK